MKLSVIVPIYNAGAYLEECLDSILELRMAEMEVICVDDGSTDDSPAILKRYAEADPRIRIVCKANTGYGDTMNTGISLAQGDYIAIVESDDMLIPDSLLLMLDKAITEDADVVKGNYYCYADGKNELFNNMGAFRDGEETDRTQREQLFFTAPSLWSAVYKRSFLTGNDIRFLPTPGAAYQDTSFAFKVWLCAKKVIVTHSPVIRYRTDNAASSSHERGKIFNLITEFEEIDRFFEERKEPALYPVIAKVKYLSAIWNINRLAPDCRTAFAIRIHYLFRDYQTKGYLIRKYWNDEDWELVHKIVYNLKWYCDCLRTGYSDSDLVTVIQQLRHISPVYIYGTDFNGRTTLNALEYHGVNVDAFIETEYLPKCVEYNNKALIKVESVKPEGIIILGVGSEKEKAISILKEHRLYNYIDLGLQYEKPQTEM